MTKEEILEYVMETPENTNRMVLSDMLDQFGGSESNTPNSSSALIVTMSQNGNTYTLDKTMGEIIDAMPLAYLKMENSETTSYDWFYAYTYDEEAGYGLSVDSTGYFFQALALTDYPSYESGEWD